MSVLKNRLKAIESALMPPRNERRFIALSIADYDDDADLIGYQCNDVLIKRMEGESLNELTERVKSGFIDSIGNSVIFLQPIYYDD